jgi:hypothetical protein
MSWMEVLPFIGGLIAAVVGGALIADAALRDEPFGIERRRAARPERNRVGQGCLGGSLVCTALVLLSGGGSPFSIAATFVGIALVIAGVVLSWRYLMDVVTGASGRFPSTSQGAESHRSDDANGTRAPAYGWPAGSDE